MFAPEGQSSFTLKRENNTLHLRELKFRLVQMRRSFRRLMIAFRFCLVQNLSVQRIIAKPCKKNYFSRASCLYLIYMTTIKIAEISSAWRCLKVQIGAASRMWTKTQFHYPASTGSVSVFPDDVSRRSELYQTILHCLCGYKRFPVTLWPYHSCCCRRYAHQCLRWSLRGRSDNAFLRPFALQKPSLFGKSQKPV